MTIDLRTALEQRLAGAEIPAGDLERARTEGLAIRRRRRAAVGACVAGLAAAAVVVTALVLPGADKSNVADDYASLGPLDFSQGARAYFDPRTEGTVLHLGGRSFPASEFEHLDTDAAATPYGVVFFDDGRPMLLDESGEVSALVDGPVDHVEGFHPTAKADADDPLVAWATLRDGVATLTVRNMETGDDFATDRIECGACENLVIEAIDRGTVFVRNVDGIRIWNFAKGAWSEFAGPKTRIADVRGGVVLYDGERPAAGPRWMPVPGAIDAQLSHLGSHVLSWSNRLEPTVPQLSDPLVLGAQGTHFTFDTDGSVLVAGAGRPDPANPDVLPHDIYDCELPSGSDGDGRPDRVDCEKIGTIEATAGDPGFIGNDM